VERKFGIVIGVGSKSFSSTTESIQKP